MATRTVNQVAGSPYYTAKGVSNAQIAIQAAINASSSGDVVTIAAGLYTINDHIWINKSGITVQGVGSATVVKLAGNLPNDRDGRHPTAKEWGYHGASGADARGMFMIGNVSNVTLQNMEIDGSADDLYPAMIPHLGLSLFNMVTAYSSTYLKFIGLSMIRGCNDAIALTSCNYVEVKTCNVNMCGHDCVQVYKCKYIVIHDNIFVNRCNASVRFSSSQETEFFNNDCRTGSGGLYGVEMQGHGTNAGTNLYIHHNVFHNMVVAGIGQITNSDSYPSFTGALKIYNNLFYNCKGGIDCTKSTASIYNNIIDKCGPVGIKCGTGAISIDKCVITNSGTGVTMGATTVSNCTFFGNSTNTSKAAGSSNKTANPGYTNTTSYTLPVTHILNKEKIGITAGMIPHLVTVNW